MPLWFGCAVAAVYGLFYARGLRSGWLYTYGSVHARIYTVLPFVYTRVTARFVPFWLRFAACVAAVTHRALQFTACRLRLRLRFTLRAGLTHLYALPYFSSRTPPLPCLPPCRCTRCGLRWLRTPHGCCSLPGYAPVYPGSTVPPVAVAFTTPRCPFDTATVTTATVPTRCGCVVTLLRLPVTHRLVHAPFCDAPHIRYVPCHGSCYAFVRGSRVCYLRAYRTGCTFLSLVYAVVRFWFTRLYTHARTFCGYVTTVPVPVTAGCHAHTVTRYHTHTARYLPHTFIAHAHLVGSAARLRGYAGYSSLRLYSSVPLLPHLRLHWTHAVTRLLPPVTLPACYGCRLRLLLSPLRLHLFTHARCTVYPALRYTTVYHGWVTQRLPAGCLPLHRVAFMDCRSHARTHPYPALPLPGSPLPSVDRTVLPLVVPHTGLPLRFWITRFATFTRRLLRLRPHRCTHRAHYVYYLVRSRYCHRLHRFCYHARYLPAVAYTPYTRYYGWVQYTTTHTRTCLTRLCRYICVYHYVYCYRSPRLYCHALLLPALGSLRFVCTTGWLRTVLRFTFYCCGYRGSYTPVTHTVVVRVDYPTVTVYTQFTGFWLRYSSPGCRSYHGCLRLHSCLLVLYRSYFTTTFGLIRVRLPTLPYVPFRCVPLPTHVYRLLGSVAFGYGYVQLPPLCRSPFGSCGWLRLDCLA